MRIDALLERLLGNAAWLVALIGAALTTVGTLLPWTYDRSILHDLTVYFYPAGAQVYTIILGGLALVYLLAQRGPLAGLLGVLFRGGSGPVRMAGIFATVVVWLTLIAIAAALGGMVNVDPGGFVSGAGALILLVGSRAMPVEETPELNGELHDIIEILIIAAVLGGLLLTAAYALNTDQAWIFVLVLIMVGGVAAILQKGGLLGWFTRMAGRHRRVTLLAAFVVAFLFPLTQGDSDANMSIATQILIFAATAIGLNIVVGLAGLLDLGYVAFLGSGAYVGAMLSASTFANIGWTPPFPLVLLIGALVAGFLGIIIGSPTLRVSGDYLAIVTLAFGEIFRLTVNNLDGTNGPDLTNGPNGIPAIPDLELFGFNFGDQHTIFGVTMGRFANYYFVLLILIAFVITVFARLNNSRIGRGWIAIREDERAAEAMGVNTFGLKLLAFAGGAMLAGLAGTIKAHHDVSVTPDQYVFLESAFLVAAIVLGGMGTVAGVLLGATILKLLPEKLRFFSEYRLLFFGAVLILMMRFRPEGLVASRRRQLEFHEEDEALAERVEDDVAEVTAR
ncbi:branched-chain amino acid ABC transporter permease [Tenggerimyces flavus]|uniref:Branched-chain amino acid ABC transporter permease n=1 Tax=Tenggerimyces flavus TaxID=1708749 RepID=A0ABV7YKU6_9ACTN|nr:branched-chain amino acid ABC transporter permease [Tenggerimyces flavus]MBM7787559.1 branched-chain amino acid transport system permease protein [Tenggerimyces flavus]